MASVVDINPWYRRLYPFQVASKPKQNLPISTPQKIPSRSTMTISLESFENLGTFLRQTKKKNHIPPPSHLKTPEPRLSLKRLSRSVDSNSNFVMKCDLGRIFVPFFSPTNLSLEVVTAKSPLKNGWRLEDDYFGGFLFGARTVTFQGRTV